MSRRAPHPSRKRDEPLVAEEVRYAADPVHRGWRLDAFLAAFMTWRSRSSIQKLIQEGTVTLERGGVARVATKPSASIVPGDVASVMLPRPKRDIDFGAEGPPPDPDLNVLYEDRWLVALDKPPNVAVHPAGRNLYRTVITALHRRYRKPDDPERDVVPKLCHRIDYETSGVLLVAKDDRAHRIVSEMFARRAPDKEYLAIVRGVPDPPAGVIDLPLGPAVGCKVAIRRGVRHDRDGQEARTSYEVVEVAGAFSLLRLKLHTGRHHQIRVHCAAIGHPLVGDKIYGGDEELFIRYYDGALTPEDEARLLLPRQALHAHRLRLPHPITGEPLDVAAPLPADLRAFLEEQR